MKELNILIGKTILALREDLKSKSLEESYPQFAKHLDGLVTDRLSNIPEVNVKKKPGRPQKTQTRKRN